jgi:hypothetical protein
MDLQKDEEGNHTQQHKTVQRQSMANEGHKHTQFQQQP